MTAPPTPGWGDRAPPCTLINFVDDATGKILYARFVSAETTASYLEGILDHPDRFGRPCAYYSDKHGIFRVNLAGKEHMTTQLAPALKTLDIELINANTPQAKGRVERSHKTSQDRLVKEMRLAGIQTTQEANVFLRCFIEIYNRKFAVQPASPQGLSPRRRGCPPSCPSHSRGKNRDLVHPKNTETLQKPHLSMRQSSLSDSAKKPGLCAARSRR
ncbi:MAG: hypothetical protein AAF471_08835, partial [Myxococcota bacterium]